MYHRKGTTWNLERVHLTLRKWPISTAEPPFHHVCCVISQTAKSICFLLVRMLRFKTWWLKNVTLLPGSASKPWAKVILEKKHHFHRYWKRNTDGSTKSGLAGTCSQPDFTPMASTISIFQQMNFDPALDQMLLAYCQLERKMATKETYRLYSLCAGMFTSLKSNIVMTHNQSNN